MKIVRVASSGDEHRFAEGQDALLVHGVGSEILIMN